jgi:bifunctional DNA-binding transcriptional regulator/antitoxin component of YhaV-PrlF toxin-antitoxin module
MTYSTLTSKGQTTIPMEVRKALNLKPRQRIIYEVKGSSATLKAQTETILASFASVKVFPGAPRDWKKIRNIAHQAVADNADAEGRR